MNSVLSLTDDYQLQASVIGESATLIGEVDELNVDDAGKVVLEADGFLKAIEKLRVDAVKPHLEAQRAINAKAKELTESIEKHRTRINRLIGDYGAVVATRERERLKQQADDMAASERALSEKVSKAESIEEITQLRETHALEVEAAQVPTLESALTSIKVKQDWDIEVVNAADLYAAHPAAVELKPRLVVIKSLANLYNGAVPGVICRAVNVAKVR